MPGQGKVVSLPRLNKPLLLVTLCLHGNHSVTPESVQSPLHDPPRGHVPLLCLVLPVGPSRLLPGSLQPPPEVFSYICLLEQFCYFPVQGLWRCHLLEGDLMIFINSNIGFYGEHFWSKTMLSLWHLALNSIETWVLYSHWAPEIFAGIPNCWGFSFYASSICRYRSICSQNNKIHLLMRLFVPSW